MSNVKKKEKNIFLKLFLILLLIIIVFYFFKNHKSNTNTAVEQNSNNSAVTETTITDQEEIKPSVVESLSEEEIELSKKQGLPVLMYHFFYDEKAGETGKDNNYMEIHDFENQIKYLSDNKYYVPTWDEVLGYISGKNGLPNKSVVITVDDGDESFFRLAVPVLQKYNITATSFLITSWYTAPEKQPNCVDYQSHSHDMHKGGSDGKGLFLTISYEGACKDLEQSRSIIGSNCKVFCYPFGHFNERCKKILKDCNYSLAFTTQGGRVFPGDDPYELSRVRMSKGESLNSFISKVK